MPELPEVETMRKALLPYCNQAIIKVEVNNPSLRQKVTPSFITDITGAFITNIERLGKYLLFSLSNQKYLLMHAGMSGKFIIESTPAKGTKELEQTKNKLNNKVNDSPNKNIGSTQLTSGHLSKKSPQELTKHNHIILTFKNGSKINFNDPRRFGLALTFNSKPLATQNLQLGIDALSPKLTINYLRNLLQKSSGDIKTALLNQKIIAGIGNIYASEILFYSKIHPLRTAKSLTTAQIELLLKYTKEVLLKAISLGGSTLKDYQAPDGAIGYFQNNFAVYNKEKQPCNNCATAIAKITQKGRSTYFCPFEQIL